MLDWLKKNIKLVISLIVVGVFIAVYAVIAVLPGETYKVTCNAVNNASAGSKPVYITYGSASISGLDHDDLLRPGHSNTFTSETRFVNGSYKSFEFYAIDENGRQLGKAVYEPKTADTRADNRIYLDVVWDGKTLQVK